MFELKEILGAVSAILGVAIVVPYVVTIVKGTNKPHMFSWIIWTAVTGIAAAAQIAKGADAGAWNATLGALSCAVIAAMAAKYGTTDVKRSDVVALCAALGAIPLWLVLHDPTWSVIVVCTIDVIGYYPTLRKSFDKPFEENLVVYFGGTFAFGLSMLAMSEHSIATLLHPIVVSVTNLILCVVVLYRRKLLHHA